MTKSELIDAMAARSQLTKARAELVVNCVFEAMTEALQRGEGIEIRGFGSFTVRPYKAYSGRNPRTGAPVPVPPKRLPFFKVGKELKELVNNSRLTHATITGGDDKDDWISTNVHGAMSFPAVPEQMALLTRGIVDLHVKSELEQRLEESRKSGKPLRVKAGFDPTRPDLHVGHSVLLAKMRQFQECGHQAILLVGEFTAMVGDPTGKSDLRPRLSREEIASSAKTYTDQAFKILDRDRTEVRNNSDWLDKLTPVDTVELMAKMTVSRMLERNDFAKRYADQRPIYMHEFLYPLLQGYDSVALENDIELGGTDQLFNLLVGRDLMSKYGQRPQMVMTTPLLEGIDAKMENGVVTGAKMSKSADNYIGLTEAPLDMHRKVMQVDDEVIFRYFELLSSRSNEEIAALKAEKANGRHPKEIKALFAKELVTRFHDEAAAIAAAAEFEKIYAGDAIPADVPEHTLTTDGATLWIAKALSSAGLVKSTGEGKRLVEQGGVEIDQQRVTDGSFQLEKGKRYLLRVGSKNRRFAYVVVAP